MCLRIPTSFTTWFTVSRIHYRHSWRSLSNEGNYWCHLEKAAFQTEWAANTVDLAARYKMDGAFLDGPGCIPETQ